MKIFENYAILEGKAPAFVVEIEKKSSTVGISQEAGKDDYEEVKPKNKPKDIKWRKWGTGNEEYIYRLTCGTEPGATAFSTFGFMLFEPRTVANENIFFDVDVMWSA